MNTNCLSPFDLSWEPVCNYLHCLVCRHYHHRRHIHLPARKKLHIGSLYISDMNR